MAVTTTPPVFESADGLSPECRTGLRNLLVACADTKLLMGYHYGEWTFGTPALEAAVANCSLAQSELGHVRLLHGILKAHFGEDPDRLVELRPATAFASVTYLDDPLPDWPAVVAMNFVVDLAVTRVVHALRHSAFLPIRSCAEKLLEEERYHAHHGRGWFRTLAGREDNARRRVEASVQAAVGAVVEWFGPDAAPEDRALVAAGIKAAPDAELRRALLADVAEAGQAFGIKPVPERQAMFDRWDAARRRVAPGGPSDEVLYHLRGTKNAIFKLT